LAQLATIDRADAAFSIVAEMSVIGVPDDDAAARLSDDYPWAIYLRPIPPELIPPEVLRIAAR
jgi:hypothetical protein